MQQTFMHACMVVPCVASDACVESSSYIYGEYLASLSGTDGHARSAHQCVRDEQSRPRAAGAPTRITSRALAVALVSTHPRAAGARGEPEPGEPCRVARRRRRRGRKCLLPAAAPRMHADAVRDRSRTRHCCGQRALSIGSSTYYSAVHTLAAVTTVCTVLIVCLCVFYLM